MPPFVSGEPLTTRFPFQELDNFNEDIDARAKDFETKIGKILPPTAPETRKAIEEAKKEAVDDAATTAAATKPNYKAMSVDF